MSYGRCAGVQGRSLVQIMNLRIFPCYNTTKTHKTIEGSYSVQTWPMYIGLMSFQFRYLRTASPLLFGMTTGCSVPPNV